MRSEERRNVQCLGRGKEPSEEQFRFEHQGTQSKFIAAGSGVPNPNYQSEVSSNCVCREGGLDGRSGGWWQGEPNRAAAGGIRHQQGACRLKVATMGWQGSGPGIGPGMGQ